MSDNKMRQEFEVWAKAAAYDLSQTTDDKYWCFATISAWQVWQAAYAACWNSEREAMVKPFVDFAKALTGNKSIAELIEKGNGE